jgi:hypothetical protein
VFRVERYGFSNRMTNLNVEEGSRVNDHVSEEPDRITIEAFIGGARFEVYDGNIPDGLSEAEAYDNKTRIRQAYHELLRMKQERQPLDLVTGLDVFHNMIITSFAIDRDAENGADLSFSMTFQRVRKIRSAETTINASAAHDQCAETVNMGQSGKTPAPRESAYERVWHNNWRNSRGTEPTREEFLERWRRTPEQFAEIFGG